MYTLKISKPHLTNNSFLFCFNHVLIYFSTKLKSAFNLENFENIVVINATANSLQVGASSLTLTLANAMKKELDSLTNNSLLDLLIIKWTSSKTLILPDIPGYWRLLINFLNCFSNLPLL
ncbi:unnamed protein product [[Candida] boidinii]|uniref:Unnamed protein product n=1 Tax=Candida boidinii TaxID=5477 RepID=A0A9W6T5W3_CANBO|nr:unnamed protein product [[Candida] boidinii]